MKNSHIIAFALLTLVIVMLAYTQYKQQRCMDALASSLIGIKQENDSYKLEAKLEKREPIGFKLPQTKKA